MILYIYIYNQQYVTGKNVYDYCSYICCVMRVVTSIINDIIQRI